MAQLVIAAAGAVAGNALGWGIASLGLSGAAVGWTVGSILGSALIKGPEQQGPRLGDLRVTGTEYGQPIPYVQAKPRVSGQIVYASRKREIPNTQKVGKGGGQKITTYTYEVDLLILLSENPIAGVSRIWSNGDLVYAGTTRKKGTWDDIRVYLGADDQLPDPTYEAAVTHAPAYRGRGYVFIQGLQLGNSGQIPNLTFELATATVSIDDRIRLLVNWPDGDEEDQSLYALGGPDISAGGAVSSGRFRADFNTAVDNRRVYEDTSLNAEGSNTPLTYEILVDLVQFTSVSQIEIAEFAPNGTSLDGAATPVSIAVSGASVGRRLSFTPQGLGAGTAHPLFWSDSVDFASYGLCHIAMTVYPDDTASIWVNGSRKRNRVSFTAGVLTNPSARIQLGGTEPSLRNAIFDYSGARVSRAELYTGDSFIPPTTLDGDLSSVDVDFDENTVPLFEVCSNLLQRAEYQEAQFDVSGLGIVEVVRGLAVGQLSNTRSVLEMLQSAYAFVVSKTNKIILRERSNTPVATIPYSKLNAQPEFGNTEGAITLDKTNDLSIPGQVAVSFHNVLSNYTIATEYSDRLRSTQVSTQEVQIPIGLLPEEGKRAAERLLFDLVASSVKTTIKVPLEYAFIEPSDSFNVVDADGQTYTLRCEQKTDTLPMIELQCVLDDVGVLDTSVATDDGYESSDTVRQLADTAWVSLDIPLLRDEDDLPGWYVGIYPVRSDPDDEWPGGVYVKSTDNVTYEQVDIIGEGAVVGVCADPLGAPLDVGLLDTSNELIVTLDHGELSAVTLADILLQRELNVFLVGDELIQAYDVALIGTSQYRVRGMIRGLRGTEWAIDTHEAGERFVHLTPLLRNATHGVGDVGNPLFVKAVTLNDVLDDIAEVSFTDTGRRLKPFSPAQLRARASGSDLLVEWNRRTRRQYRYGGDNPVVPLGEESEAYRVQVYDGATLVRTEDVTTPSYTYTAAAAAADGFASSDTVTFVVAQLSGTIGPGYPSTTQGTLP